MFDIYFGGVLQSIGLVIGGEAEPLATENGKDKVHLSPPLREEETA